MRDLSSVIIVATRAHQIAGKQRYRIGIIGIIGLDDDWASNYADIDLIGPCLRLNFVWRFLYNDHVSALKLYGSGKYRNFPLSQWKKYTRGTIFFYVQFAGSQLPATLPDW